MPEPVDDAAVEALAEVLTGAYDYGAGDEYEAAATVLRAGYRHVPEGSRVVSEGQGVYLGERVRLTPHEGNPYLLVPTVEPQP